MMATMLMVKTSGANISVADGNMGSENRRKPYPPILSRMPARITEPAVGASTWASGSQVWTGHIGILTAKLAKKASHSQVCICGGKLGWSSSATMSVVPVYQYMLMIASSISTEPTKV